MKYFVLVLFVSMPLSVFAKMATLKEFKEAYPEFQTKYSDKHGGNSASCNICHTGKPSTGNPLLNPYGEDVKTAPKKSDGKTDFSAIESKDSDGDSAKNKAEIDAGYMPGDKDDHP